MPPFPNDPAINDTYTENNDSYVYLGPGTGWRRYEVNLGNSTNYASPFFGEGLSVDEHVEMSSHVSQSPSALDTALQLQVDNNYTGVAFDVSSSGIFTMKKPGIFDVRFSMSLGRDTNVGDAFVVVRGELDPGGATSQGWITSTEARVFELENSKAIIPVLFNTVFEIPSIGTVPPKVRAVLYRDSIGTNDGGVVSINTTLFGASASMSLNIIHSN